MDHEHKDMSVDENEGTVIVLTDDEGAETEFELIDMIELDSEQYVVLLPVEDEDEGGSDVVILHVVHMSSGEDGDEEDEYEGIEDEAVLNKVFDLFKEKNADMFDFVD